MDEPSGQRPFMKLKLSSGKPAGEASRPPEGEAVPKAGKSPESDRSKTASPFMSPPPGLSPSASRTAPTLKTFKPAAPGNVAAGEPAAAPTDDSVPPAPVETPREAEAPPVAPKTVTPVTFSSVGSAPPPTTKLRLNVLPAPGEAPPVLPPAAGDIVAESLASVEAESAAANVGVAPAADAGASPPSGAVSPAAKTAPAPGSNVAPAVKVTPGQAPKKASPVVLGLLVVALVAVGGIASLRFIDTSEPPPPAPTVITPPVATSGVPSGEPAPADAADADLPAVVAPETAEVARTRNPDLVKWLEDARITAVSSDKITINRHIYAFGAAVNPEGTLKWVGRDSVKGTLLFMDEARVVYEKSPR